MQTHHIPRVGIGIMIFKDGHVLLGKRINAHGAHTFSFPGGHLEHMESFEDCAKREVFEECGLKIKNLTFILLANIKDFSPKHYVQISYKADWAEGTPIVKEPDKCEGWSWYPLDHLPHPLFIPAALTIKKYKTQLTYMDTESHYSYDEISL